MTPLSRRPPPTASYLFYERLAPDATLCQKKFSRDLRHSALASLGHRATTRRRSAQAGASWACASRAVIASWSSSIRASAISSGQTREHLNGAIATILDAGRTDGSLRADVQPADVTASMAGIMLTAADIDQATRMLQLLVDGLLARDPS